MTWTKLEASLFIFASSVSISSPSPRLASRSLVTETTSNRSTSEQPLYFNRADLIEDFSLHSVLGERSQPRFRAFSTTRQTLVRQPPCFRRVLFKPSQAKFLLLSPSQLWIFQPYLVSAKFLIIQSIPWFSPRRNHRPRGWETRVRRFDVRERRKDTIFFSLSLKRTKMFRLAEIPAHFRNSISYPDTLNLELIVKIAKSTWWTYRYLNA